MEQELADADAYVSGRRCVCSHQMATLFASNDVTAAILVISHVTYTSISMSDFFNRCTFSWSYTCNQARFFETTESFFQCRPRRHFTRKSPRLCHYRFLFAAVSVCCASHRAPCAGHSLYHGGRDSAVERPEQL